MPTMQVLVMIYVVVLVFLVGWELGRISLGGGHDWYDEVAFVLWPLVLPAVVVAVLRDRLR